jgi:hypothetical protein
LGKGDWWASDRVDKTDTWKNASAYNLSRSDGFKEYRNMEERASLYGYVADELKGRGDETKWARGAQSVVDSLNLGTWLAAGKTESFLQAGNSAIFNDAFANLAARLKGDRLQGSDAKAWDLMMVSHEQNLLQPLYNAAEVEGYAWRLANMMTLSGSWYPTRAVNGPVGGISPIATDPLVAQNRFDYGVTTLLGYTSSPMPDPGTRYLDGSALARSLGLQ